jgi:hypothetical protein
MCVSLVPAGGRRWYRLEGKGEVAAVGWAVVSVSRSVSS